jgi:hypothetical protein
MFNKQKSQFSSQQCFIYFFDIKCPPNN